MNERYEKFTLDIAQIHSNIQRIKAEEMREFGLTARHVNCLYYLYQNPDGALLKDIVRECGEDKASVSRTLAALKDKGLVRQPEEDGRKYRRRIELTQAGLNVAKSVERKISDAVDYTGKDLSDSERTAFYDTLSHLSERLNDYTKMLRVRDAES